MKNVAYKFYKKEEDSELYWVANEGRIGEHLFSFDKKKIYNLFRDYPFNMTDEEVAIFDRNEPFWEEFMRERKEALSGKVRFKK